VPAARSQEQPIAMMAAGAQFPLTMSLASSQRGSPTAQRFGLFSSRTEHIQGFRNPAGKHGPAPIPPGIQGDRVPARETRANTPRLLRPLRF